MVDAGLGALDRALYLVGGMDKLVQWSLGVGGAPRSAALGLSAPSRSRSSRNPIVITTTATHPPQPCASLFELFATQPKGLLHAWLSVSPSKCALDATHLESFTRWLDGLTADAMLLPNALMHATDSQATGWSLCCACLLASAACQRLNNIRVSRVIQAANMVL